ncbi:MAG TPA: chemotaxis protein CheW [Gemmatimonadaceae bacterium]|nr:chemotaxis protein CheW [Gemmatimonadaceae bacterium]
MTLASIDSTPDAPACPLVLFRLGARVYGIELEQVCEIIPFRNATRLPGAPPYVCGLINLRGSIVTIIDLGSRLDGGAAARSTGSVILVERGSRVVGLAVDEALEVQELPADALEAAPADEAMGGVVRAVGRLGELVVILLDAAEIVRQVLL